MSGAEPPNRSASRAAASPAGPSEARNEPIDLLRAIGLLAIVLAHVDPPRLVFQLRNFDVPLMVLVAGMSFGLAAQGGESYADYLRKRIKRLVLPVWIFLALYFLADLALHAPRGSHDPRTVLETFLLIDGIGYVWIIRVFVLVALLAPLIAWFERRTRGDLRYLATLALLYALYEAARAWWLPHRDSIAGRAFEISVLNAVPYSILFAIGLRARGMRAASRWSLSAGSAVAFAACALLLYQSEGRVVATQAYKYPPSIYYLSYALFVYTLLLAASAPAWRWLSRTPLAAPLLFVARNSIWVYLWHIALLPLVDAAWPVAWPVEYALVLSGAGLIAYAQVRIVTRFVMPRIERASTRKNLALVFTG